MQNYFYNRFNLKWQRLPELFLHPTPHPWHSSTLVLGTETLQGCVLSPCCSHCTPVTALPDIKRTLLWSTMTTPPSSAAVTLLNSSSTLHHTKYLSTLKPESFFKFKSKNGGGAGGSVSHRKAGVDLSNQPGPGVCQAVTLPPPRTLWFVSWGSKERD